MNIQQSKVEHRIKEDIKLSDLKFFFEPFEDGEWSFVSDLEAVSINNSSFSLSFQAVYWYIQYHLLRDGRVEVDNEMFQSLINEENAFFDTLTLQNESNSRVLKRVDGGDWVFFYRPEDKEISNVHFS